MYMGARHKRISQEEYDEFLELFIKAVKRRWPNVLLQFEDFAQPNAMPLLKRYRNEICSFNDDIQGTAAVTVGSLLAACRVKGAKLSEQKVVFVGLKLCEYVVLLSKSLVKWCLRGSQMPRLAAKYLWLTALIY